MKAFTHFFGSCLLLSGLLLSHFAFAIPTIQHWQTDNGVRVYFVPAPDLPMVDVEVVFDAGSARDANKPGLAQLTNSLLSEGAGGHSADYIAEHFDNLGAELDNTVSSDMATVSLRSLSESQLLQPALEMLALLLAKPAFGKTSLERIQQQMFTILKYQQQSPDDIGKKAFYRAIFGTHPYATLPEGTLESVAALTRDDVKAFHARYYVAQNAIITIVGALDKKAAEKLANTVASQLSVGKVAPLLPPVAQLNEAKSIHIAHPSKQTHIFIGQPGVIRGDPDYFTLYTGNYILGGSGLVSNLAKEIREKRGLAYSVYSYFSPRRVAGPFLANLETRNENTTQALQVVRETMRDFIEKGPSEDKLKKAKQGITGRFPLRIKSNSNIIGYLSMIGFYNLPLDYLHTFNDNVEAVTLEMIKDAFKRRLNLDKLVTVTVGDKNP
ncbi:pitrilysin family protein [Candidatus Parabeggiatoa sp. HSG14]|uniref:M16 family metallopeptidase n=1 Tax=Candidatus Parabeggiatoa sp. HSG14 TaxID=3055593 RepID=UPI0025A783DA|nr:pitrilysin family protein [Thiotrichales bacterium HSG14]